MTNELLSCGEKTKKLSNPPRFWWTWSSVIRKLENYPIFEFFDIIMFFGNFRQKFLVSIMSRRNRYSPLKRMISFSSPLFMLSCSMRAESIPDVFCAIVVGISLAQLLHTILSFQIKQKYIVRHTRLPEYFGVFLRYSLSSNSN